MVLGSCELPSQKNLVWSELGHCHLLLKDKPPPQVDLNFQVQAWCRWRMFLCSGVCLLALRNGQLQVMVPVLSWLWVSEDLSLADDLSSLLRLPLCISFLHCFLWLPTPASLNGLVRLSAILILWQLVWVCCPEYPGMPPFWTLGSANSLATDQFLMNLVL